MSFDLLSEPIKRYIRDKRWDQLRPIQAAAINRILTTRENYILASRTASGKTEAAFLPILSQVDFNDQGVQVLYISPLIALINDQFVRIEELCKYLDVAVVKWHGEANKSSKNKLIAYPKGLVLITPESLEAMLANKPFQVINLFWKLKFAVLDEIHSFLGSDRGIQLKSILSRIQFLSGNNFRFIGLSATIGDYNEAKNFFINGNDTKILLDKTAKEIQPIFRYIKNEGPETSLDLIEDIYSEVKDNKVLLFPNSRGRAEEFAVKLKRVAQTENGHVNYFSHHSSVDKEVREYIERFAKTNVRENFCICCTSTLELGIDIGTVDEVVQVDATHSISSLVQRVGRSGRKDGVPSKLLLYATNQWSLLQSIACWTLYKDGFIEPNKSRKLAYDILLHQALSVIKSHSGIAIKELVQQLHSNTAFTEISEGATKDIIEHLIVTDLVEKLHDEVIIGLSGEKVVNNYEFYSVFKTEENFKVVHAGNSVGELPFSPQLREDQNILLAAKIWKIKHVDFKAKRIEVVKAFDGKAPVFGGDGGDIHPRVRESMLAIVNSSEQFDFLDEIATQTIEELRLEFSAFQINDIANERPLKIINNGLELYSFTGSSINRALQFLFSAVSIDSNLFESHSFFVIKEDLNLFYQKLKNIPRIISDIDELLLKSLEEKPEMISFSKWGRYLPSKYQVAVIQQKYYDFENALEFLEKTRFIVSGDTP